MVVWPTRNIEAMWVGEHFFVAVGRCVIHDDLVASFDLRATKLDIGCGGATEVGDRGAVAQHLFDSGGPQRFVGT